MFATTCGAQELSGTPGADVVDDARLSSAADDARNWLVPGGAYTNAHYSALKQIDRATISALAPARMYHTGLRGSFEATPAPRLAGPQHGLLRSTW